MEHMIRVLVSGLPASGKTTFLAALWNLIFSRECPAALRFHSMPGDSKHLNALSERWVRCLEMDRTMPADERVVEMKLQHAERLVALSFPDLSGETWNDMWERRRCSRLLASIAESSQAVLLFIHSDTVRRPLPVVEMVAQAELLGQQLPTVPEEPYSPHMAPTQVKLVDLLQLLSRPPLASGPRRLAILLSAWDCVEPERMTPAQFLAARLPLLDQYLGATEDYGQWRVYGVSAQGGDLKKDAESLRRYDKPCERTRIVDSTTASHDLSEPLTWLMS